MASESSSLLHPALSSDDGGTTDSEIKLPQTFKQTQTSNGATYTISRRRNSVLAGCLPLHIFLTSFLFLAILICLTLTFFPLHLFKAIVPFPTVPKSLQATRDGLLNMVPNRLPTDHSAIPTNAPWSNLLFAAESNAPNAPTQPFHTTPYILSFQQSAGILATSTLFTRTTHTKTTDAQLSVPDIALSALSALDTPLTGAKGPLTIPSHSSMTTVLELLGLKISVTIGDPYLTILATAPGLRITTVNGPWSAITPITLSNGKTVHLITGGEGSDNTWILYAQENTVSTVASDGGIAGLEVTTDKPTIVRLFSLPSHYVTPDDFDYDTLTNGFTQCYPVSSKITSSTRDYGRSGTPVTSSVQFAYEFNYLGSGGECVHEFLTMPHHGVGRNAAAYYSTRDDDVGTLKGVHGPIAVHPVKVRGGQGVLFEEGLEVDDVKPLKSKDFKTASSTALREVEKSLKKLVLSKQSGGTGVVMEQGIYGLGKELARIASETAISYESGGVLYSEGIAVVSEAFEYLFVTDGGQFYYDPKVGGIIAKDSAIDLSAEFGAGAYNDHHYHYGYLIYAYSLVLAVEESRSVDLQLEESQTPTRTKYGQYIDALRMDVCHETPTDGRFTTFRHFDFYNSHSWASGLFPMANGKSQESVSEALNCYYACAGGGGVGGVVAGMEVVGAQHYWQTWGEKEGMVGVVGDLDVSKNTWFGDKIWYTYGVNVMPITPATERLLSRSYVEKAWARDLEPVWGEMEESWKSILVCMLAVADADLAWKRAMEMGDGFQFDAGLSKGVVLWFIERQGGGGEEEDGGGGGAECSANKKCAALAGLCCPTEKGVNLECC